MNEQVKHDNNDDWPPSGEFAAFLFLGYVVINLGAAVLLLHSTYSIGRVYLLIFTIVLIHLLLGLLLWIKNKQHNVDVKKTVTGDRGPFWKPFWNRLFTCLFFSIIIWVLCYISPADNIHAIPISLFIPIVVLEIYSNIKNSP